MRNEFIIRFALCITLVFLSWGCFTKTELRLENRSSKNIDSVVVYINSYKAVFVNVKSHETQIKNVSWDSLDLKHDVSVLPHIYFNDSVFNGQYYYNDLGGIFKKGKFVITDGLSTKWEALEY